jgi:Fic family protein
MRGGQCGWCEAAHRRNSITPKYQLTREQAVFLAKRNVVDYIYKSAKLEGLGVTYPDTAAIFVGADVTGVKVADVIAVNNLKHAWQFLLDTLDVPLDFAYMCRLNQIVGGDNLIYNAGYLRKLPVSIGGTSWRPDLPEEESVKRELNALEQLPNATERAIATMLYMIRGQFFLDGNKRTAMLAANRVMIASGQGVLSVPVEQTQAFAHLLVAFYESNEPEEISAFVYAQCIDGLAL